MSLPKLTDEIYEVLDFFNRAKEEGFNTAKVAIDKAYEKGKAEAHVKGYNLGFSAGSLEYHSGYRVGYDKGYSVGVLENRKLGRGAGCKAGLQG